MILILVIRSGFEKCSEKRNLRLIAWINQDVICQIGSTDDYTPFQGFHMQENQVDQVVFDLINIILDILSFMEN